MQKFKAALLDDNKEQLEINKVFLLSLGTLDIVTTSINAETFLKEVKMPGFKLFNLHASLSSMFAFRRTKKFTLLAPPMRILTMVSGR